MGGYNAEDKRKRRGREGHIDVDGEALEGLEGCSGEMVKTDIHQYCRCSDCAQHARHVILFSAKTVRITKKWVLYNVTECSINNERIICKEDTLQGNSVFM